MAVNFLPNNNDPLRNQGERWRAVVAVMVLILAGAGGLLRQSGVDNQMVLQTVKSLTPVNVMQKFKIGGDIMVPPPISKPKLPELIGEMLPAESFTARSVMVKDNGTGAVLYRKNEYDKWPLASITKLMSALVILENNPDWAASTTVVGEDALDTHMYAGDIYTLDELWHAALIGSSNKAVLSLVSALGWSDAAFVERMNQKARELGMTEAVFLDSTGLDANDVASASDVAILLNEVMRHEKITGALLTAEYNLYSKERKKPHHMWNTDWLFLGWIPHQFKEFYGGKTGYIAVSGYNFTMRVGDGAGHVVDVVVLGAASHETRFIEAKTAAEWAFQNYKWPE
ncbi:MAG: D-alanyl-D-alanine carboxypeptidase [Candidatus Magasanikbacteria bacterium]|nr:D-alanyl-D-alanine carboxypeptidase [Candidatus Magasanikbacteria bacterium]